MQYIICGVGGQGVISFSRMLAEIGKKSGKKIVGSEIHGMSKRGADVLAHLKIGEYYSPMLGEGEADILIGFDDKEAFLNLGYLKKGGEMVVNDTHIIDWSTPEIRDYIESKDLSRYVVDGYGVSQERLGSIRPFNVLILGFLARLHPEEVDYDIAKEVIKELLKPSVVDVNLKALDIGYKEIGG